MATPSAPSARFDKPYNPNYTPPPPDDAAAAVTSSSNAPSVSPSTSPPAGFNKHNRDIAKLLLTLVSALLFWGQDNANAYAMLCAGGALYFLKRGTLNSVKNLKWILLSVGSVIVSAFAHMWDHQGMDRVSSRHLYRKKLYIIMLANFAGYIWSMILMLFLISTYSKKKAEPTTIAATSIMPPPPPPPPPPPAQPGYKED